MSSMIEEKVEQFAQKLIELHGFRRNNGLSCVIPDTDDFPSNEGIFLWGFSQTRKRFETKIEKFHTNTRIRRMNKMIGISAKEYVNILPAIKDFLKSLQALGFEPIGKGVEMFDGKERVFNVQARADVFENKLENLKKFEKLTLNNPVIKFVEKQGYFKVENKDKLAWDVVFGNKKGSQKAKAKSTTTKKTAKPVTKKTAAKPSTAKNPTKNGGVVTKKPPKSTVKVPTAKPSTKSTSQTTSSQARNIWLNQTGAMYKKIQSWLAKSSVKFNTVVNRLEDSLGPYDIETLEISVKDQQVVLKPIETDVFGAIGRIDVISGNNKTMLLLFPKGKSYQWEIWNNPDDRQNLNKTNVDKLLAKWLKS
ncbi:hypothetical protein QUF50_00755 [Thiotrichales bacterium HSG1]|nr:hypothetical protein [Thiotrichales bacterium HSG1]